MPDDTKFVLTGEDLVVRLRQRNVDAAAELYTLYSPRVYKFFLSSTHEPSVAEDLSQELFLRIWCRIDQYDLDKGSFNTWVFSVARNLKTDYVRRRSTRLAKLTYSIEWIDEVHMIADPGAKANFHAALYMKQAMSVLPRHEEDVISLAYFEGYTQTEVTKILETSLSTFKDG